MNMSPQYYSTSTPDLVLVSTDSIALLELSVVTNIQHHFLAAKTHKEDCYGSLLSDLQQAGYLVDLATIEVGSLGHFIPETYTVTKLSSTCLKNRLIMYSRQLVLPFPVLTGYLTLIPLCHGM